MLTYHITITLSDDKTLTFDVSAKDTDQARKFGLATGKTMLQQKGKHAAIKSIDVDEFYDD